MRGCAEAIEAKRSEREPFLRHAIAAPADQPRTQERRCFGVVHPLGERKAVACVCNCMGGVASIAGVAGEQGSIAKILMAVAAVRTYPAREPEPRHPDALANRQTRNFTTDRRN